MMEATQAEELDKPYQEGDKRRVGSLMKTIWLTDKDCLKKQLSLDQDQNSKCSLCFVL